MLFDRMYVQSDILGSALHASFLRNDVIVNNLANSDTPDYKRKAVDFEASLAKALDNYKRTGELDLSNTKPTIRTIYERFNYRIDKNNVDVELEMASLYQNSIKYDTIINSIQNNSRRLSLALTGR